MIKIDELQNILRNITPLLIKATPEEGMAILGKATIPFLNEANLNMQPTQDATSPTLNLVGATTSVGTVITAGTLAPPVAFASVVGLGLGLTVGAGINCRLTFNTKPFLECHTDGSVTYGEKYSCHLTPSTELNWSGSLTIHAPTGENTQTYCFGFNQAMTCIEPPTMEDTTVTFDQKPDIKIPLPDGSTINTDGSATGVTSKGVSLGTDSKGDPTVKVDCGPTKNEPRILLDLPPDTYIDKTPSMIDQPSDPIQKSEPTIVESPEPSEPAGPSDPVSTH